MLFNLLFLPLIGGYFFVSKAYLTAFYVARQTRERLVFSSALAAIFLLMPAHLLAVGIAWLLPDLAERWRQLVPFEYAGTAFLALALGLALPFLVNYLYPREQAYRRIVHRQGVNALERLFLDAQDSDQALMLTLESGKVYVGFIQWTPPNPNATDNYIRILPMLSGYRRDETLEVEFTTTYAPVIQKTVRDDEAQMHRLTPASEEQLSQARSLRLDDFVKVLPTSQIVSAGKFDHEVYRQFNTLQ